MLYFRNAHVFETNESDVSLTQLLPIIVLSHSWQAFNCTFQSTKERVVFTIISVIRLKWLRGSAERKWWYLKPSFRNIRDHLWCWCRPGVLALSCKVCEFGKEQGNTEQRKNRIRTEWKRFSRNDKFVLQEFIDSLWYCHKREFAIRIFNKLIIYVIVYSSFTVFVVNKSQESNEYLNSRNIIFKCL